MEKTIICYCAGGLGNRIRPLSSCYSLSLLTNRKLIIIWPDTSRCQAKFDQLYDCDVDVFPDTFLKYIENNCSIYGQGDSIYNEYALFGRKELPELASRKNIIPIHNTNMIKFDTSDHIIIITNNFLSGAETEHENHFIKNILAPSKQIQQIIDREQSFLNLDKNTIGMHARATDFFEDHGVSDQYYFNLIRNESQEDSRIFVCSDSGEMEVSIKTEFIGSREILIRENKSFLGKINGSEDSWVNNLDTTSDSVIDAVVDMYLLAKTDFRIYNNASTFAHIIERLK